MIKKKYFVGHFTRNTFDWRFLFSILITTLHKETLIFDYADGVFRLMIESGLMLLHEVFVRNTLYKEIFVLEILF